MVEIASSLLTASISTITAIILDDSAVEDMSPRSWTRKQPNLW
jgi:hypothetical protein